MDSNLLITDEWAGRTNDEKFEYDAEWENVAAAIHRLDGHKYTTVLIEKLPEDSDANEGDTYLSIGGGPDHFVVTLRAAQDAPELFAVSSTAANDQTTISVNVGGQSSKYPVRFCVDVENALAAARAFFDNGDPAPQLSWSRH